MSVVLTQLSELVRSPPACGEHLSVLISQVVRAIDITHAKLLRPRRSFQPLMTRFRYYTVDGHAYNLLYFY